MQEFIANLVNLIEELFNLFGIFFILWGGVEALIRVIWGDFSGKKDVLVERINRKAFASKLILGLEFFIAVDILSTFEHTTWEALGKLAALIMIRAILSFVLTMEMKYGVHEIKKSLRK